MRCTYCFYRDEVSERSVKNYGMMTEETADILIKRALEEPDGSVFPCDFYVLDGYEMGNIRNDSLSSMDRKRKGIGFVKKSLSLPEECRTCSVFSLCHGGCRREREDYTTGKMGVNRLCSSYKEFLTFADKAITEMAYWENRARRGE